MVLDPRAYKGTNYTPCIGTNFVANLGLLPMIPDPNTRRPAIGGGFFDDVHCAVEMREIGDFGFNSIRIVGSFFAWLSHPTNYIESLRRLCRLCTRYGISITYCLWNSTPWGAGVEPEGNLPFFRLVVSGYAQGPNQVLLDTMFTVGRDWLGNQRAHPDANISQFPEPVPGDLWDASLDLWDSRLRDRIEEYLVDVCTFFSTDREGQQALGSFDLYNEPDVLWSGGLTHRLQPILALIQLTHKIVRRETADALCTVGWAGVDSVERFGSHLDHNKLVERAGVHQDYYSFHSYHSPEDFPQVLETVRPYFRRPIPVVCSEFWDSTLRGRLGELTTQLRSVGYGGQMWGLLQHNAYKHDQRYFPIRDFDGVRIPDPYDTILAGSTFSFQDASYEDAQAARSW